MIRRRRRSGRAGTAAIEFALCAPVLLATFIGAFSVYQLIAAQRMLEDAVARALRYGAVNSSVASATSIGTVATTTATSLLGSAAAGLSATVTFTPSYAPGNTLTVALSYAWPPALLQIGWPSVTLTSSGSITVQN